MTIAIIVAHIEPDRIAVRSDEHVPLRVVVESHEPTLRI